MIGRIVVTLIFLSTLFGCDGGPSSPRGFSLPVGDAVQGEIVFKEFKCLACHRLEGYEEEGLTKEFERLIILGGESTRIVTYAELVTSIINPSHKISGVYKTEYVNADGSSKMRNYNDVMTVQQLIDVVAFLQPKYKLKPYEHTNYKRYH